MYSSSLFGLKESICADNKHRYRPENAFFLGTTPPNLQIHVHLVRCLLKPFGKRKYGDGAQMDSCGLTMNGIHG